MDKWFLNHLPLLAPAAYTWSTWLDRHFCNFNHASCHIKWHVAHTIVQIDDLNVGSHACRSLRFSKPVKSIDEISRYHYFSRIFACHMDLVIIKHYLKVAALIFFGSERRFLFFSVLKEGFCFLRYRKKILVLQYNEQWRLWPRNLVKRKWHLSLSPVMVFNYKQFYQSETCGRRRKC